MNPILLDQEFWLEIRKQTKVNEKIGEGQCLRWCVEAGIALKKIVSIRGFVILGSFANNRGYAELNPRIGQHQWLELREGNRRFIADGTAGQLCRNLPKGFYGYFEQVPRELKRVYQPEWNESLRKHIRDYERSKPSVIIPYATDFLD